MNLDELRIATPCPVAWEDMLGDNTVRFCNSCKLNVYNISSMSKKEAEELISGREGRLCLRFYQRNDGTVLVKDCPIGLRAFKKQMQWLVTAAAGLISLCLTWFGLPLNAKESGCLQGNNEPKALLGEVAVPIQIETTQWIVYTTKDIPKGTKLTAELTANCIKIKPLDKLVKLSRDAFASSSCNTMNKILSEKIISRKTRRKLPANSILLQSDLTPWKAN